MTLLHLEQFIWMPKEEYFARNCSSAYLCFSNFLMYIFFVLGFNNNHFMVELIFLLQVLSLLCFRRTEKVQRICDIKMEIGC
uniref:Putative ovule protein n=1 Tax=Solanum chacoense TaxID=4108 RepID=A0A0V0GHY0_SOLCH